MTDAALAVLVCQWIVDATDAEVADVTRLPARGYQPDGDGLTVRVATRSGRATSTTAGRDASGNPTLTVESQDRVRLSVNGYGNSAVDWVRVAAGRWGDTSDASETLRTAGVYPVAGRSYSDVRRVDAMLYTDEEPRAQVDLVCYVENVLHTATRGRVQSITVDIDDAEPFTIPEPTP